MEPIEQKESELVEKKKKDEIQVNLNEIQEWDPNMLPEYFTLIINARR